MNNTKSTPASLLPPSGARMNRWLALLSLIAVNVVQQPGPVVRTRSGLVRGRLNANGRFHEYFGLPYATVNETNRFKAPFPPPTWDGILDAINENTRCPQKMVGPMIFGEPDCLKLNIYSPTTGRPEAPLPVMVYIHGGCFMEGIGTGFLYGGDYFAEYGVVFVGLNYRLNVEGFLCLGTKDAPGNAGLKDQIAALKWIKENIRAFGGDPDNVTLFGESAGAVSTSFLILSPAAKGLFHKAILQSGSTLAPWALQHDPIKAASNLAKEFGQETKDPHELYNIISQKSVNELISAIKYNKNKNYVTADTLFAPCVENDIPGIEPAFTQHPSEIIASGNYSKLPMVVGFNDGEGILLVAKDFGGRVTEFDKDSLLQPDLEFPNAGERNETVDKIFDLYFPSDKVDKTVEMIELYSDLHFKMPTVYETELYSSTNEKPMYFYVFKYSGLLNMPKWISKYGFLKGASHADELFYMFKPHSLPFLPAYMEEKMFKTMLTLWTNFAKFSNPTPEKDPWLPTRWEPSRAPNPLALFIDKTLSMGPMWNDSVVAFWDDIYSRYRKQSYGFKDSNFV